MSAARPFALEAKVLSVSGTISAGARPDRPGSAVEERLTRAGFSVLERRAVPDGLETVAAALRELADGFAGLVVAAGGCGLTPDDLTPEATRSVLEREAPGLSEAMRRASADGCLSRGVAGTRGHTLILNTPGSPHGAVLWLEQVLDQLPTAVRFAAGRKD
jgi:molybdenum cofactor synthesis domain-containing protein